MQSMRFVVSNAARECGVAQPVVCIIKGVKRQEKTKTYDIHIKELMGRIDKIKTETLPSQEVQGFRELYSTVGSKVEPAGERLLRICSERSFTQYSNLVDAYNLVALEYITPIGVHDAKDLLESKGPLFFRRAKGDEKILPSFSKKGTPSETIPQGDFTYGIKKDETFTPFAWLGQKDTDSEDYRINKKTKAILVTMIGNKYTTLERNAELCQKVLDLIKLSCPAAEMEILYPEFVEAEKA